ncbi:MAG: DNA starvation/stationary phase protection protein [Planctomycetota bacterium]
MSTFRRQILSEEQTAVVHRELQQSLTSLIDLSLVGKQLHWTVIGTVFESVHRQLDDMVDLTRSLADDIAERVATLGVAPDGRAAAVAEGSCLPSVTPGFSRAESVVASTADSLHLVIQQIRRAIAAIGAADPISEDLLIGAAAQLEKTLWMFQTQELG